MQDNQNIVECDNLVKIFKTKEVEVVALQGLDLFIREGELTAIIGKSGSGKSTLLNIIAGLDRPSAGKISVAGKDLLLFNDRQLKQYNRGTIGFIWQNNARNLIPYLTALQNVEVPMLITRKSKRRVRAMELLNAVGLSGKYESRLQELSGGEQQRVAIAIALANEPRILLADEPTGSVDSKTAYRIMELFNTLNGMFGVTVIIVTHDLKVSEMVKRVISICDGMIGSEILRNEDYAQKLSEFDGQLMPGAHDEYAIVDRKGRIRIPDHFLSSMNIKEGGKIKIRESGSGIELYSE